MLQVERAPVLTLSDTDVCNVGKIPPDIRTKSPLSLNPPKVAIHTCNCTSDVSLLTLCYCIELCVDEAKHGGLERVSRHGPTADLMEGFNV